MLTIDNNDYDRSVQASKKFYCIVNFADNNVYSSNKLKLHSISKIVVLMMSQLGNTLENCTAWLGKLYVYKKTSRVVFTCDGNGSQDNSHKARPTAIHYL